METKICKSCGKDLPLSEFYIYSKNGMYYARCNICTNKSDKDRRRTKHGFIVHLYGNQRYCARLRGHDEPKYSGKELEGWLLNQEKFHELYHQWIESNYQRDFAPSCDRINNNKSYTLDNLQLVTSKENQLNQAKEVRNGRMGKPKPVIGINENTGDILRFVSAGDAARWMGTSQGSISYYCRNEKIFRGYNLNYENG